MIAYSLHRTNQLLQQSATRFAKNRSTLCHRSLGFTLVELMVGMALGIFLVGGVVSVYVSSQQNFKTSENLGRIQENARFAFELMGRDIREEGSMPCGVKAVASIVRDKTNTTLTPWWADWNNGTLVGYEGGTSPSPSTSTVADAAFGTTANKRIAGTDALAVLRGSMDENALRVIQLHDPVAKSIAIPSITGYEAKDVVLACDETSGAIFEILAIFNGGTTKTINYGSSAVGSVNCTDKLGWPQSAACTETNNKTLSPGGFVTNYDPAFWYIGVSVNDTTKRSLYRLAIKAQGTGSAKLVNAEPREMVTDVDDLQLEYLTRDNTAPINPLATTWVSADNAKFTTGGWTTSNSNEVVAVRVTLTFKGIDKVGSDGNSLERKTVAVIALRNREIKSK
jgi:type IV pilus assembly protein PilW